ncbi:replication fork protection component Swi3-domain-containing protein [Fomitopsis serialis]|uniref:replication fork protection component Swi3-domain-containing protein n=1 Tax=Fomitopsis serialis TaxID=139415 RepID=UPI002007C3EC|nr:replication fork protection component Swi3-domain-containing protein [Neoantrodia serialis]KAH9935000.1 replication fork protection component Swi3-domain-containing protein [Neoantrodia serialis]
MTSVALEDIWDAPADEAPRRSSPPIDLTTDDSPRRASKRPRSSLFLDSEDEDEGAQPPSRKSVPPTVEKSEIDAMFDNLDAEPDTGDGDLPPALDLDALRREVDAKNAQIYKKPQNRWKERQKKKPLPRLDEARLLGPDGFPALMKHAKAFKPKGKGHEATDLNRLIQVYHYWTHKMYPRAPFRETVKTVEKRCHSKRMHVALTVWRDEYKGINTGHKVDPDSDESGSDEEEGNPKPNASDARESSTVHDIERASSRPPSHPPSSEPPSSDAFNDFDLDAMIREEEERQALENNPARPTSVPRAQSKPVAQDEDDAMWDALEDDVPHSDGAAQAPYVGVPSNAGPVPDEDEDMWDVIREMEAAESNTAASAPPISVATDEKAGGDGTSRPATNDEGWDEMYM